MQTAEMKFLQKVKGCPQLDKLKNEDRRQILYMYALNEENPTILTAVDKEWLMDD